VTFSCKCNTAVLLLLQVEARYALAVGRESSDKLAEALANKAEVRHTGMWFYIRK
jgi:hypothetical protein